MINVKNTIVNYIAGALTPHYCCSCGVIGELLCASCKYNIVSEPDSICFGCKRPIGVTASCSTCRLPYSHMWTLGARDGGLQRLVNSSKYEACRDGCDIQAHMLHEILPALPDSAIVTAVPTIARHIRERGYDHAAKIAKSLATLRKLPYTPTLMRLDSSVQQGASRSDRIRQAAQSYQAVGCLQAAATYILVDDVVTTGATLEYAARALKDGGAKTVWAVATAYQPN